MATKSSAQPPPTCDKKAARAHKSTAAFKEIPRGADTRRGAPGQQDRDARLERLIKLATAIYGAHPTPARLRRLTRLVMARSATAIQRLERERGIALKTSPYPSPNTSPTRGKVNDRKTA